MSVKELVITTLKPLVSEVYPVHYGGDSKTYIVFNSEDENGINYADDEPEDEEINLQIHLYTHDDYTDLAKQIKKALFGAGFSYPKIEMEQFENDTELNHVTFSCSYVTDIK